MCGKWDTRELQSSPSPIKYKPVKEVWVPAIQLEIPGGKTLFSAKLQQLVQGKQHQVLKHKEPLQGESEVLSSK